MDIALDRSQLESYWSYGSTAGEPLLSCFNLEKNYHLKAGTVQAVAGVTLGVMPGDTLGLVGESGCGKSTLGRLLMRLEQQSAGHVEFDGEDITAYRNRDLRRVRRDLQIILQDPYTSLNPRMTVAQIIGEPLTVHRVGDRSSRVNQIGELLDRVGLSQTHGKRYPHELSGGQRQRVGIARALALNPKFIVCDEAVSALDLSVQAQVLNLLSDLRADLGLTYLFISHNLAVVRHIANRVAVMYMGQIVEVAASDEFFRTPYHPYSQLLLSAVLDVDAEGGPPSAQTQGEPPSPVSPPSGCRFRTRCPFAQERCIFEKPDLREVDGTRAVACHFWEDIVSSHGELAHGSQ